MIDQLAEGFARGQGLDRLLNQAHWQVNRIGAKRGDGKSAATAVCNVGPGLGPIIGPVGNFSTLPDAAKWLLTIGMLLGRLEILTVLVLLTKAFWKH